MRRIKFNIGTILFIYSIFVSVLFIGSLYLFRDRAVNKIDINDNNGVFIIPNHEWEQGYINQIITLNPIDVTNYSVLKTNFYTNIFANYWIMIIPFSLFILITSLILWKIILKLQQKENNRIASSLIIDEDKGFNSLLFDKSVNEAIEKIREKVVNHFEDYKRFNSYVSHEQKNTIAVLRASLESKNDEESIKVVDELLTNIEDILTISDSKQNLVPVDIVLVCAKACDDYKKIFSDISFEFDEDSELYILGKLRWIDRAIRNLLDNAIKYGNGKPIKVSIKQEKNSIILAVRDYGKGIPLKKQNEIFENRVRLNELNKDGYGIGLSLVSHVIDLCDGFVYVDSKKNKGSCFYLSFQKFSKNSSM